MTQKDASRYRLTLNLKEKEHGILQSMADAEGRTLSNMAARAILRYHEVVYSDETPKA